ncbi:MAG TPA: TetR/AcrR family transcriptional regulator [Smithella sp.]|nr:TetR/AcrR family transcriptional regulator [Smithella sp.]
MKLREKKSRKVKQKIVTVARNLVLKQGYQKTTVRQIIEAAGVSTSTLYHFFQDKEDIFLAVVFDIYIKSIQLIHTTTHEDDAIFLYALNRVVELKAAAKHRVLAQIFFDVYSSRRIRQKVLQADNERCKLIFKPYTKKYSDDDFYVRSSTLWGMRLSFITECVHLGAENFEKRWPFLVETDLQFFNVPKADIKKKIEKIAVVINEKSFTIFGLLTI